MPRLRPRGTLPRGGRSSRNAATRARCPRGSIGPTQRRGRRDRTACSVRWEPVTSKRSDCRSPKDRRRRARRWPDSCLRAISTALGASRRTSAPSAERPRSRPCLGSRSRPLSDTGSHAAAASGETRAKTKGGVGPAFTRDVLVANSEAHHTARSSVVDGDRPGVPRFHERGSRGTSAADRLGDPRNPRAGPRPSSRRDALCAGSRADEIASWDLFLGKHERSKQPCAVARRRRAPTCATAQMPSPKSRSVPSRVQTTSACR